MSVWSGDHTTPHLFCLVTITTTYYNYVWSGDHITTRMVGQVTKSLLHLGLVRCNYHYLCVWTLVIDMLDRSAYATYKFHPTDVIE